MAESERERLRSKTPVIAAQVGATLTVTVAMSFLGVAGTMTGLIVGTVISQVSAFFYEQWVILAHHTAQRKMEQFRTAHREGIQPGSKRPRPVPRYHLSIPYRTMAAGALAVLILSGAVLVTLELALGKPVSAVVTRSAGSGTSFDPGPARPAPSPAVTVPRSDTTSPTYPAYTASPTPTVIPTGTVSPTPAATPALRTAPSPTAPATVTPAPSPSAAPTPSVGAQSGGPSPS